MEGVEGGGVPPLLEGGRMAPAEVVDGGEERPEDFGEAFVGEVGGRRGEGGAVWGRCRAFFFVPCLC